LSTTLPEALPILAEVVRQPAFAQDELDRLRAQRLDALSLALSDPGALADLAAWRAAFGAGPYGHPQDGTPGGLKRIDRAAVAGQYQRLFRPDEAILVVTGDVEPTAAFALARQAFGDWPRPSAPPAAPPAEAPATAPRVIAIDLPDAGQAAVMLT